VEDVPVLFLLVEDSTGELLGLFVDRLEAEGKLVLLWLVVGGNLGNGVGDLLTDSADASLHVKPIQFLHFILH
jgi:hypothetical protein